MRFRTACAVALVLSALPLAACNTTTQQGSLAAGQTTTVAFESIDGPPPAVFQRLVRKLNDEAEARRVPVVTREGFAPYRIRGYVAVGVEKRRAVVFWVLDVYDTQAGRTLRLTGEEKAGPAGRDAWAAATDEVLARVARAGMEQLAVYFRSPEPYPGTPEVRPVAVAQDDFKPESFGITRHPPETAAPETAAPAAAGPEAAAPQRPARSDGQVALAEPAR
jgi:hypothetical protein